MSATAAIDVVIHDDLTADVCTTEGRVVHTVTVDAAADLGAAVGDYVAEQARRLETSVLVRTTRDGSDNTLLLIDPERNVTTMVLTDDGTAVPAPDNEAGEIPAASATVEAEGVVDVGEQVRESRTQTEDFAVTDPDPATTPITPAPSSAPPAAEPGAVADPASTQPIPTAPAAHQPQTPRPAPTGPVQVSTGAAGSQDSGHPNSPQGPSRTARTPRPQRPTPAGKRGVGPHVPRPTRPAPAGYDDGGQAGGRLGQVWAHHRRPILVLGAALLAVVVGAGLLAGGLFSSSDSQAPTDPVKAMQTADPTSDAVECPTRSEGATTTGRDPGNQTSGANVIKAFDYAYYTWRSGTAARAMVSSDGKVAPAIQIQSAIDILDQDLRYCLSITDRGNGVYGVELTEIPPIGQPRVIRQEITTTEIGGKYWIAAIEKDTPQP